MCVIMAKRVEPCIATVAEDRDLVNGTCEQLDVIECVCGQHSPPPKPSLPALEVAQHNTDKNSG